MSIINDNFASLSKKEVQIIQELEFKEQYFFTREDIKHHTTSRQQLNYVIHRLIHKNRIVSLNRNKYYLIPIQAPNSKWSEHEFILIDEMMDGKDYYIGGWAAANHYKLTDQIPMSTEVYTNKRNGKTRILNANIIFRKTTDKRIKEAQTEHINGHQFKILPKEQAKKWLKNKNY